MNEPNRERASRVLGTRAASRIEYAIIAVGLFALFLIFQPFSLALYGVGCALVVFAGLANNLLPLCQPGTPRRALFDTALIIALSFLVIMLLAIASAHLYGVYFATVTVADESEPFYRQTFVHGVAAAVVVLAATLFISKRDRGAR